VHNSSETSFTLHDDLGDAHVAAQRREEDDELDGINVVHEDNECGFLGDNEGDNVIEAVVDEEGFQVLLTTTKSEVK